MNLPANDTAEAGSNGEREALLAAKLNGWRARLHEIVAEMELWPEASEAGEDVWYAMDEIDMALDDLTDIGLEDA